jgi:hypothetical protein
MQSKTGKRVSVPAFAPIRLFCGEVVQKWPHLPSPEVEGAHGDPEKLTHLLQSVYGYSSTRAKKELDSIVGEFYEKLKLAS